MSGKVDEAARAGFKAYWEAGYGVSDEERWKLCARAMIAAMREMSPAVRDVLEHLIETQCHDQTLDDGWRMLIDAALKED